MRNLEKQTTAKKSEGTQTMMHTTPARVLYPIVPIVIQASDGTEIATYALLDTGSSRTLLDRSVYEKLGIRGTPTELPIKWTQGIEIVETGSYVLDLKVRGTNSKTW